MVHNFFRNSGAEYLPIKTQPQNNNTFQGKRLEFKICYYWTFKKYVMIPIIPNHFELVISDNNSRRYGWWTTGASAEGKYYRLCQVLIPM